MKNMKIGTNHVSSSRTSLETSTIAQNQKIDDEVADRVDTAQYSMNNSTDRVIRNEDCTIGINTPGYPSYVTEELALFHKLQSRAKRRSADIKLKESIDLGIRFSRSNNQTNVEIVENNSDSTDCEIIWVKKDGRSHTDAKRPTTESNVTTNPKACSQENVQKRVRFSNNPTDLRKYNSTSLPAGVRNTPNCLERPNERPEKTQGTTSDQECTICLAKFTTIYDLKLHLNDHVDHTKNVAETHKRSMIALLKLEHQIRTNRLRKRHLCTMCEKVYLNRSDLRSHLNTCHANYMPYQCQICLKYFKTGYNLNRHGFTHCKDL